MVPACNARAGSGAGWFRARPHRPGAPRPQSITLLVGQSFDFNMKWRRSGAKQTKGK